jgi:hypothetical protein
MEVNGDMFVVFALSSAISAHLVSKHNFNVDRSWYDNKWFWAGLFGNLPALIAIITHLYLTGSGEEKSTEP